MDRNLNKRGRQRHTVADADRRDTFEGQHARVNGHHQLETDTAADTTTGHHSRGKAAHLKQDIGGGKRSRLDEKKELIQQWIHWIQRHYHRLHHQPYFVPLVHFNRLTFEPDIIEGVQVKVITPSKQLSDVRENESHSRVHYCFYHLFQMLKEVLFAVWGLDFDTYLNNLGAVEDTKPLGPPSSGAKQPRLTSQRHEPKDRNLSKTAAHRNSSSFFLRPRDLSTELQRGTFDVLLIAKDHGIVVCEIKAIGDAFGLPAPGMGNVDELEIIRGKVKKALKQLDKEKKVLRRLTEDLDPSLSIRSTLILPNLKKKTLEAALHVDQALKLDFCSSMGCTSLPDALERCVFAEQLPPIGKPWDMDDDVTEKLTTWWRLLVGNDRIEDQVYEGLVARFCGPATPLHVNTACRSRVEVSTLSDAVLETADCFKDWTLSEDQACIVKKDGERRVFLTGPPGTGKTTMMVLRALRWAHRGHVVYVISLWTGSDAASHHIVRLIREHLPEDKQDKVRFLTNKSGRLEDIIAKLVASLQGHAAHDDSQTGASHVSVTNLEANTAVRGVAEDVEMRSAPPQEEQSLKESRQERGDKQSVAEEAVDSGSTEDVRVSPSDDVPEMEVETSESRPNPGRTPEIPENAHYTTTRSSQEITAATTTPATSQSTLPTNQPSSASQTGSFRPGLGVSSSGVHLICDEAPWFFSRFVQRLESVTPSVGELQVWAASQFFGSRPKTFKEVKLTQCLRCPPVVTRELEMGAAYTTRAMYHYATGDSGVLSSMPPPTDGPPVKWITHDQHKTVDVWDCQQCGERVGEFIQEDLKIGAEGSSASPKQTLQYSDVIISGHVNVSADVSSDAAHEIMELSETDRVVSIRPRAAESQTEDKRGQETSRPRSGFLRGLQSKRVPYDIITNDDPDFARKLASPDKPDRVQVAEPKCILGLKWKVVVVIGTRDMSATYPRYVDPWCDVVARCLSQLIVVGDTETRLEERLAKMLTFKGAD